LDLARLSAELDLVLTAASDGSLYRVPPCDGLDPAERGIRDIAFSGDGEPTTSKKFREAVQIAADARRRFGLDTSKLVLITDAAYLTRPAVREALRIFDENNGEIWAKLDAGTEEYFRLVDRPNVSLQQVLDGILDAARERPVVIQSLWLRLRGEPPPPVEIAAYCDKLNGLVAAGGRLKLLQLYTTARRPAARYAAPLSDPELDAIAVLVRARVPVPVEVYYGVEQVDQP